MRLLLVIMLISVGQLQAQTSDLFGRVLDEDGNPYAYIELELEDLEIMVSADKDGNYRFTDVPIGDYPLKINHQYGAVYKAVYMDGADFEYDIIIRRRIDFDEITVAATRANVDQPITTTNLSREEIEMNDLGQDLPYMLKRSPSVFVSSDAGTGIGYTGVRVRGLDPSHVNVTLNGIPLNDSESQLVFWVNMPDLLSSTESIEIQRGIGGSTFGAGDFGAAVSVNTNKVRTKSYIEATGGIGSFNTRRANLSLGTGLMNNKFTIDGRLSYVESDGYIDRARAELNSFMISAAWLGLNSSLRFNVLNGHEVTYQAWNGVPVSYVEDDDLRTFNSAGQEAVKPNSSLPINQQPYEDQVDNYTQTHLQLFYNLINDAGDWSSALHYTRGLGYFELYQADEDLERYNAIIEGDTTRVRDLVERRWLDNHFVGANASWRKSLSSLDLQAATAFNMYLGDHFGETIGLVDTGRFEVPPVYYENDATKTDFNAFVKGLYHVNDQWKAYLDLQYRRVQYEYDGIVRYDRPVSGDATFNFFNPKVGLTFLPSENTKVYATYGRGNKEPNRDDFIDSPDGQAPEHEKLNNVELGIEQSSGKFYWGLQSYYMGYQDQLVLTGRINDVGEYARTNVDNSYRLGLELQIGAEILPNLSVSANATWSQNKIDNYTEFIDNWDTGEQVARSFENTTMALSPEWIGYIGLNYTWNQPFSSDPNGKLQFILDHKYVGDQYLDNTENESAKIDGFFYADAGLQYTSSIPRLKMKEIVFKFRVMNVYNYRYETTGWNYRFTTTAPDVVADNIYARDEGNNIYTETGLFPQAPVHFQSAIAVRF